MRPACSAPQRPSSAVLAPRPRRGGVGSPREPWGTADRRTFLRLLAAGTLAGCRRSRARRRRRRWDGAVPGQDRRHAAPHRAAAEPRDAGALPRAGPHAERRDVRALAPDLVPTSIDEATYRLQVGGHVERPARAVARRPAHALRDDVARRRQPVRGQRAQRSSSRACPACSGAAAPSATPSGRGCGCATCSPRRAPRAAPSMWRSRAGPRSARQRAAASRSRCRCDVAQAGEPTARAWAMNDAPLPMMNGYPLRLVVPGLVLDLLGEGPRDGDGARPRVRRATG